MGNSFQVTLFVNPYIKKNKFTDGIKIWWINKTKQINSGEVWNRKTSKSQFIAIMGHSRRYVFYYYMDFGEGYTLSEDKISFFKTWEKTGWQS